MSLPVVDGDVYKTTIKLPFTALLDIESKITEPQGKR